MEPIAPDVPARPREDSKSPTGDWKSRGKGAGGHGGDSGRAFDAHRFSKYRRAKESSKRMEDEVKRLADRARGEADAARELARDRDDLAERLVAAERTVEQMMQDVGVRERTLSFRVALKRGWIIWILLWVLSWCNWLVLLRTLERFFFRPYKYVLRRWEAAPAVDQRPDAMLNDDLLHLDPKLAYVKRTAIDSAWSSLPGKKRRRTMLVSMELVSQLVSSRPFSALKPESAFERIHLAAERIHKVNLSRWLTVFDAHVVRDSADLAYGLYCYYEQLHERSGGYFHPNVKCPRPVVDL